MILNNAKTFVSWNLHLFCNGFYAISYAQQWIFKKFYFHVEKSGKTFKKKSNYEFQTLTIIKINQINQDDQGLQFQKVIFG